MPYRDAKRIEPLTIINFVVHVSVEAAKAIKLFFFSINLEKFVDETKHVQGNVLHNSLSASNSILVTSFQSFKKINFVCLNFGIKLLRVNTWTKKQRRMIKRTVN